MIYLALPHRTGIVTTNEEKLSRPKRRKEAQYEFQNALLSPGLWRILSYGVLEKA
jgi:hypothetical protein